MKQKTPDAGEPQADAPANDVPADDAPANEPRPSGSAVPQAHLQSTAAPRVKVLDGRAIALDHPDPAAGEAHLMAALGTTDRDFYAGIVEQLGDAAAYDGKIDEKALNFMLSAVKGIKPRDQVETMLAAQMAVVHTATLTSARQLARAGNLVQLDYAERAITKLTRTFAAQTEALKRYRSGGEPNVTVQHVSVSDGGQAIVGNVTTRATPARTAPATPAGAAPSRTARRRKTASKRPPISPPALADVPTTPQSPATTPPAPTRRRAR
jgi:hypothetical protein